MATLPSTKISSEKKKTENVVTVFPDMSVWQDSQKSSIAAGNTKLESKHQQEARRVS